MYFHFRILLATWVTEQRQEVVRSILSSLIAMGEQKWHSAWQGSMTWHLVNFIYMYLISNLIIIMGKQYTNLVILHFFYLLYISSNLIYLCFSGLYCLPHLPCYSISSFGTCRLLSKARLFGTWSSTAPSRHYRQWVTIFIWP